MHNRQHQGQPRIARRTQALMRQKDLDGMDKTSRRELTERGEVCLIPLRTWYWPGPEADSDAHQQAMRGAAENE